MPVCDVCGNDYDKSFELVSGGKRHVFDSFECAIQAIAPRCTHCGCRIIGHGMESNGEFYCCAHCAEQSGKVGLKDRKDTERPQTGHPAHR
ncbi:MAG TPA: hypothetical protein VFO82_01330 [Steroidobacteraceae bacterium]|nr:metallothionein [uncultured bacterium]HET9472501.1 hypothetical protein [Steroidobacteraceae bacterium]